MYVMTSSCPHCGAPIYVPYESAKGDAMLLESGVWLAVQPPTYSCECRNTILAALSAPSKELIRDTVGEMQQETYRRARRPSIYGGFGSDYSAFGKGPKES